MSESKNESISKSENTSVQRTDSLLGTFVGMFWLLWGNIFLVAMAIKVFQKQTFLSFYDLFYWVIVILLIITRYCDIRYFNGITAKGSPATMAHWRSYAKYLLLASAGIWLLASWVS